MEVGGGGVVTKIINFLSSHKLFSSFILDLSVYKE